MSKTSYFLISVCVGWMIEYIFNVQSYLLILIMTLLSIAMNHLNEQKLVLLNKQEQKKLQDKMKISTKDAHLKLKQLVTTIASIPFPIILLDHKGEIVLHNNMDAIIEKPLLHKSYLDNGFYDEIQKFMKESFILEKQMDELFQIENKQLQGISVPILNHEVFSGCLLLFQDVTQAMEKEKQQKRFLADASHELKTPISIIKGMVEILNRDDFNDDQIQKEFLTQIEVEVDRLHILVKDLLLLSKLSSDQLILQQEWVDIKSIIKSCITSLTTVANEKKLQFIEQYHTDQKIWLDPLKIHQVIVNLLSNAIKYSDHGNIYIIVEEDHSSFILSVKDEGIGLSKEQCLHVFDRFYRVDDDRSRKNGGSGLGLSIVKSIVDAHQATIEVKSEIGKGSIFQIHFPKI